VKEAIMATYWLRGAVALVVLTLFGAAALGVLRPGASAHSDLEQRCAVGRAAGGGELRLNCEGDQVCTVGAADPGAVGIDDAIDIDCGDGRCVVRWPVDSGVALACEARAAAGDSRTIVQSTSSTSSVSTTGSMDQATTEATVNLQLGHESVTIEVGLAQETLSISIRR
jgi:hypothetical protein